MKIRFGLISPNFSTCQQMEFMNHSSQPQCGECVSSELLNLPAHRKPHGMSESDRVFSLSPTPYATAWSGKISHHEFALLVMENFERVAEAQANSCFAFAFFFL